MNGSNGDRSEREAELLALNQALEAKVADLIGRLTAVKRAGTRAVGELEVSERAFRAIFDHSPYAIAVSRIDDGVYTKVNPAFERMCGFSAEEIIGKTGFELGLVGTLDEHLATRDTLRHAERIEEAVVVGRRRSGEQLSALVSTVPVELAGESFAFTMAIDLTQRLRAEQALRESEARLTLAQKVAHIGSYEWEPKVGVVRLSEELARILGLDPIAFDGSVATILSLLHPSDRTRLEHVLQTPARWERIVAPQDRARIVRVEDPGGGMRTEFALEFRIRRANDGVERWITGLNEVITDSGGRVVHLFGTIQDTTERQRLESEFRQAQKMEAFGQLAGGVAHDFNNILTAIQGNIGLLQLGGLEESEHAEVVEEIASAAQRAANLTRQLLTFSRRQPVQPKELDLNEVVSSTVKMLKRLIGEHIELHTGLGQGSLPVYADPGMLEQVLVNLVVNARDAMPKGGRLEIHTAAVEIDEDSLAERPRARAGHFIEVRVRDAGVGIDSKDLPHIFEPFFTTKEVGKGTGLGLATVFGIVEQHRGWLEVESRIGEGSTFKVYLPRVSAEQTMTEDIELPTGDLTGSETILLVEDELPVRLLARRVLERHGYRVIEADSGMRALEIWRRQHPAIDLLVTDMVMPGGVSGRELADRLHLERPNLRIIYCSGYSDDFLGGDSTVRREAAFLEKPYDPKKLLRKIRTALDE